MEYAYLHDPFLAPRESSPRFLQSVDLFGILLLLVDFLEYNVLIKNNLKVCCCNKKTILKEIYKSWLLIYVFSPYLNPLCTTLLLPFATLHCPVIR